MIEKNGENKLKQKLPTPAIRENGTKTDVVVAVACFCCYFIC